MNNLNREMDLEKNHKIRVKNKSSVHHKPFKGITITITWSAIYLFDLFELNIIKGLTWLLLYLFVFYFPTTGKKAYKLEYICTIKRLVQ